MLSSTGVKPSTEVAGLRLRTDEGESRLTLSMCFCNDSSCKLRSLDVASARGELCNGCKVIVACMLCIGNVAGVASIDI
jgi:hypothetical protein